MSLIPRDLQRHVGKFYGKYSGIVVDHADPDQRGHLMVRVDTIFGPDTVVRARPCFPSNVFFVPDPDARVWVEFEAGDPRCPIWVGTWYPDGATPDEVRVDPPTHRVIHTAYGHRIELSDESGKEQIVIRHGGKQVLTMSGDGVVIENDGGSVVELKGGTATVKATNIVLDGTTVEAGAHANDPTIMGNAFKSLWNIVSTHTHPSAMGPTGPPVPVILPLLDGVHLTTTLKVK